MSPVMIVRAQELIDRPLSIRPHVVLLGAGASKAAFPDGDANGQKLPLMDDLVDVVGLRLLIEESGFQFQENSNFEAVYSQMISGEQFVDGVSEMERGIEEYFSNLSLPDQATIYDRLLLSLRPTDAVFTFNWDPFLFDAYARNRDSVPLPEIFFLHGNVRIGACGEHSYWGQRNYLCPKCNQPLTDVRLLYPIGQKDYSKDPHIRCAWEAAEQLFADALTLTIFGYGAPESDVDAVDLLRLARFDQSNREFEHIEIIDTASQPILHERWSPFTPTLHYHLITAFEESRIARWPRRSSEAVFYPMTQGLPCEDFPLPSTGSLARLQTFAADIARHENGSRIPTPEE